MQPNHTIPESSNLKQSYFIADETRDFPCVPVLPENFQSALPVFWSALVQRKGTAIETHLSRFSSWSSQGGSKNGRRTLKIFWEDWYAREILHFVCNKVRLLDDSGNCIIRKTWLHCIWFEKKFRLHEVIPHCTRSVNCRLCHWSDRLDKASYFLWHSDQWWNF